jgi:CheY-like chemotaxis protein
VITTSARFSTPPTLLVVDDDPDVRMLLCELFGREGFRVDVATDGAAAILFLEHHEPPSVILLDLLMHFIIFSSVLA